MAHRRASTIAFIAIAISGALLWLAWQGRRMAIEPPPDQIVAGVAQLRPHPGATEVDLDSAITITFDRPVVLTTTLALAAEDLSAVTLPEPLIVTAGGSPGEPVAGDGAWLTPSIYSFRPHHRLFPAETFTITVRPEVVVADVASWSFSTRGDILSGTRPYDGATEVKTDATIAVYVGPDVDIASAANQFRLSIAGDDTALPGELREIPGGFLFTPAAPLRPGVTYQGTILPGAKTVRDVALQYERATWRFSTERPLELVAVSPTEDQVGIGARIQLSFSRGVAEPGLAGIEGRPAPALLIDPPLTGEGRWITADTFVFSPTVAMQPRTTYTVRASLGTPNGGGPALERSWTFETGFAELQLMYAQRPAVRVGAGPKVIESSRTPYGPIEVRFSLPIDPPSIGNGLFVVRAGTNEQIPITAAVAGQTVVLTPTILLTRGAEYEVVVTPALTALGGAVRAVPKRVDNLFVDQLPQLISSTPASGATGVSWGFAALSGQLLELGFSVPMDAVSVLQNLALSPPTTINPVPTNAYNSLSFDVDLRPATSYTLTLGPWARDIYGEPLGRPYTITFRTEVADASAEIVTRLLPDFSGYAPTFRSAQVSFSEGRTIATYIAQEPVRIAIRHVNVPEVEAKIFRLEQRETIPLLNSNDRWLAYQPTSEPLVRQVARTLVAQPDRDWLDVLNLGLIEPGLYYLALYDQRGQVDSQLMAVSPIALTIKYSSDQLFVWAVDVATGLPVPELPLSFTLEVNDDLLTRALGSTNADGVLQAALSTLNVPMTGAEPEEYRFFISSPAGPNFSFAASTWGEEFGPEDFGIATGQIAYSSQVLGNLYTDRPMYRPGNEVFLRGVARIDDAGVYRLPRPGQSVRLRVVDARGTTIASELAPLNDTGSFSSSLRLDSLAPLGTYGVFVTLEGAPIPENGSQSLQYYEGAPFPPHHFFGTFLVLTYGKPALRVSVTPEQAWVEPNSSVTFTIEARYYTGEPAANAQVRWGIREGVPILQETDDGFRFGADESAGDVFAVPIGSVSGQTATLDDQGRLVVEQNFFRIKSDFWQSFYVEVVEPAGGTVSYGVAQIRARQGGLSVGIRPASTVAEAGIERPIDLLVVDGSGQPVAGVPVRLSVSRREWFSVREEGSEGRFYWSSTYTDTMINAAELLTDAGGQARFTFTPPNGGAYLISAETDDERGNTVRSSELIYSQGDRVFWGIDSSSQVQLLPDRTSYRPGETARIFVPAPYEDMQALVTIERDSVLSYSLQTLSGTSGLIEVPIVADHTPNIFVSVVLFKAAGQDLPVPELRVGLVELSVPAEEQVLQVQVTADPPEAGPGDTVTFTIRATDFTGAPAQAELALALVDQRLLDLYRLATNQDPTPFYTEGFFRRRSPGVRTANTMDRLADRTVSRLRPGAKGGAGGPGTFQIIGSATVDDDTLLRREFKDTALWMPAIRTDATGTVQVSVELPDNLTTWRMVARAITADTRFGQGEADLVVGRELLIEPIVPEALLVGDRAVLRAVLRNRSDRPMEVVATLNADGLRLFSREVQTARLEPGSETAVRWEATAESVGIARLTYEARSGFLRDGVELDLPVQRYVGQELALGGGQVRAEELLELDLPTQTAAATGRDLIVNLLPSLSATVAEGLQRLEAPDTAGSEQVVSGFLARLQSEAVGSSVPSASNEVSRHLQRLYQLQNLDGGWSWWGRDGVSSPYLTVYALEGLVTARSAGHQVDAQAIERALGYIRTALNDGAFGGDAPWRRDTRAYALYVLTIAGELDIGRVIALYEQRDELGLLGQAYLLLNLHALGDQDARMATLSAELSAAAIPAAAGSVIWAEPEPAPETLAEEVATTAIVARALLRADPDSSLLPRAALALLTRSADGASWATTHASALTLATLAEVGARSRGSQGSIGYRVALGARVLGEGSLNAEEATGTLALTADLAGASGAELRLTRRDSLFQRGSGPLAYVVRIREYENPAEVEPQDQGLEVERRYLAVDPGTLVSGYSPISTAQLAGLVQVELTVTVPEGAEFLVVEDALPAGLEPVPIAPSAPRALPAGVEAVGSPAAPVRAFNHVEFRRNRVVLYANALPRGTFTYTYLARAVMAGTFQAPPTTARLAYDPTTYGRSAGSRLTINELDTP